LSWVQWTEAGARYTDAVVRLAAPVADALLAQLSTHPTRPAAGRRCPVLQSEVSPGPFLTGELLDLGFSTATTGFLRFPGRAHAHPDPAGDQPGLTDSAPAGR
jgi:hypothetical protein